MSSLTFTLIQADLKWEAKEANLHQFEKCIEAVSGKTNIVVLPEMFTTGFSMKAEELAEDMEGETVQWMKKMAANSRVIVTGSVIIKEGEEYYNRLIWMLPNGQYGYYNKRHLFAMGEENKHYTPGTERLIASAIGWKINLMVCYDLRFPVWARQQFSEDGFEYDVLIYVANWPDRRNHAWKTLLVARAIENQCYVIGVNRVGNDGHNVYHTGDTMVVDPMGEVLYHKADEEDVFTITLEKEKLQQVRERFPFWRDADEFKILI
ncbi:MAG: amidohydrolase [Chitinophagaceae bacterium]